MAGNASVDNLHALLIGVDFYKENHLPGGGYYPSLQGCVRDVTHVEEFLTGRLKLAADRIMKLTSTNTGVAGQTEPPEPPERQPTYENIVSAFKALTERAKTGDQAYIHYSGHGSRSSTIFTKLKGEKGLDEGLVPLDISNSEARYVRDLELAKLLKTMVDKGLVVTLVLDSCHSGGATRAAFDDMGAVSRGLHDAEFDATKRPETSDVAPLDDLIAMAKSEGWEDALATRDLNAGGGWLPDAKGYVLMAACRPSESAFEASFDGKERNGALTYWLLEGLRNLRPDSTYQQLHNSITAKVHTRFSQQTPMLLGEANRAVLGSNILGLQRAVNVESVDLATSTLVLNTGDAQGVKTGARFAVFPGGTFDFSDDTTRLGSAEVTVLGAASSTCTIKDKTQNARAITVGDQAVLLDPTSVRLRRKVGIYTRDDNRKPLAKDASDRLKAVADTIEKAGKGWVALAHQGDVFEYQVAVVGDHFEIWDSSGRPIPNLRPTVPITDAGGPTKVIERLVHLSKYHSIIELDNFDKSSPLRGKLVVELLRAPDDWSPSERPVPIPLKEPGNTPTLNIGEGVFLRMRNNMPKSTKVALNVTVLNLRPGWGVTRVFPVDTPFMPIDPESEELMHLRAGLPEGYTQGRDILKVFATVDPTNYDWLELPGLDQRPKGDTRGLPSNPLEQLIAAFAAEQATRDVIPTEFPSRRWTTGMVEVNVVRP